MDGCEIRSHHFETLVEPMVVGIYGPNSIIPGILGAGFRAATVGFLHIGIGPLLRRGLEGNPQGVST